MMSRCCASGDVKVVWARWGCAVGDALSGILRRAKEHVFAGLVMQIHSSHDMSRAEHERLGCAYIIFMP